MAVGVHPIDHVRTDRRLEDLARVAGLRGQEAAELQRDEPVDVRPHRRGDRLRADRVGEAAGVHRAAYGFEQRQEGLGGGAAEFGAHLVRQHVAAEHDLVSVRVGEGALPVRQAEPHDVLDGIVADPHGGLLRPEPAERALVQGGEQPRLAAEQRVHGRGRGASGGGQRAEAQRIGPLP